MDAHAHAHPRPAVGVHRHGLTADSATGHRILDSRIARLDIEG